MTPKLRRNAVNIMLGDERLCDMTTQTTKDFSERRVVAEEQPKPDKRDLQRIYAQAVRRVSDERMAQIEEQLKEKIEQRSRSGGTGGVYVLRSAFKYFDVDQSGGLDFEELREGLRLFGMQIEEHEIYAMMARYDPDYENEINYVTFLEALMDNDFDVKKKKDLRKTFRSLLQNYVSKGASTEEAALQMMQTEVKALFNAADKQQTGHLEYSAIEKLMRVAFGLEIEPDQLRLIFMRMDKSLKGVIAFDGFWSFWLKMCF